MIGIIKGDARYAALSQMVESIHSNNLEDFYGIEELILPFKGIDNLYNIYGTNINLLDILKINSIKRIIVGNANNKLKDLCSHKNIELLELLKNVDFVIENAFLTAVGVVEYLNGVDKTITDYKIIILGFGNLGFELARILKNYKVDFSLYTEVELEEKFVRLCGYRISDFKDFDIVINTIPSNVKLDYSIFEGKRIIDLASAPYGFDINLIDENKIKYEVLSSVPSKFCPFSAAKIIKKYIEI